MFWRPLNPPLRDWRGKTVWLVGASTGIGRALAAALHAAGARVAVSARGRERLDDFVAAHPGSLALPLDAQDQAALQQALQQLIATWGRVDLCVYCAGHYRAMRATQYDHADALKHLQINYVGALNLLATLLPQLQRQAAAGQGGHLSLVSSVAGYRGLPQSLAYGPTKAALTHLAEVLYLDLAPLGLGISVVHPGFVATPLTAANEFRMPALISPGEAARAMLAGWASGRFEIHFPKRFTRVLKLLRMLGDRFYFRLIRRATGL